VDDTTIVSPAAARRFISENRRRKSREVTFTAFNICDDVKDVNDSIVARGDAAPSQDARPFTNENPGLHFVSSWAFTSSTFQVDRVSARSR
jgi:hypothetical protein